MAKPHATRTYAPLQFEALEPHRFEDLVRDLMYDFRDWQTIEATGRGGADDGYDIRAFERRPAAASVDEDEGEPGESASPIVVGNRWMIQCKREKVLGPARIQQIIEEVRKEDPPYGYILAAPANFSKKSYDAFRSALAERGVQEFHLFGRAELEDMLYMPKNDRILFAFFGVSLTSKKRTRVTEIRSTVNTKNKLYSILDPNSNDAALDAHVLLRDINDIDYPRKTKYPDFDERPRWKEYVVEQFYPDGLRFRVLEHFAFINPETGEWDVCEAVDLLYRETVTDEERESQQEIRSRVENFWEHLPRAHQGKFMCDGVVLFENIQFVDRRGDALYKFPHLYVDFGSHGPFDGFWHNIQGEHDAWHSAEDSKRIKIFPKTFADPKFGKIYKDRTLPLPGFLDARMRHNNKTTYFDLDNQFAFLRARDVIQVSGPEDSNDKTYVEVMYRYTVKLAILFKKLPHMKHDIEHNAGRPVDPEEIANVLEIKRVHDFEIERNNGTPAR